MDAWTCQYTTTGLTHLRKGSRIHEDHRTGSANPQCNPRLLEHHTRTIAKILDIWIAGLGSSLQVAGPTNLEVHPEHPGEESHGHEDRSNEREQNRCVISSDGLEKGNSQSNALMLELLGELLHTIELLIF